MALLSVLLLICVTATSYTFTHAKPVISQPKSTCSFSTQLWEGGEDVFGHAAGGACRYTVRYGQAARWVDSQLSFDVGNRTSSLPPSCPQPAGTYVVGSEQSEDCLYATIYTPKGMSPLSKLPIFVWIHGGSFYAGSASAPGLDGSKLASTGDIIVIVIQYRLGVLGYIPPSTAPSWADPNLGLRDIILGLQTINQYAALIGGDPNKVTVGGQSSGGSMIRALLGAPTAKSLFRAAIIQSDPMNYGFASPDITSQLRRAFYSQDQLKQCDSLKCLQQIPVATIVAAQNYLVASTPLTIQGVPLTMPIRPSYNNPTLTSDPTVDLFNIPASLSNDPSSIALLLSTVSNEAGSALQATFPAPVPLSNDTYFASLSMIVNPDRAKIITSSAQYALPSVNSSSEAGVYGQGGDMFRETYERAATDGIWRCPNRDVARAWSRAGGKVWVGEWTKGATYPTNQQSGGYCEQKGRVCHEEDEILSYWTSFIKDLDPNGPSSSGPKRNYPNLTHLIDKAKNWWDDWSSSWKWWKRAASTDPPAAVTTWDQYRDDDDVLSLGGGEVSMCLEGFWGDTAKYDWQLYG
ncbi:hypothetical protein I317_06124 [Kwoniella heveanensis CBS 569]|nr:hypothetical protein I317_06124 [Kwoniella heveanensis CBS 569]